MAASFASVTAALKVHVNTGQNLIMNGSSTFVSMETASIESLTNRVVEQAGGAQFRLPSNFTLTAPNNRPISIRVSEPRRNVEQPFSSKTFFHMSVHDATAGLDGKCQYKGKQQSVDVHLSFAD